MNKSIISLILLWSSERGRARCHDCRPRRRGPRPLRRGPGRHLVGNLQALPQRSVEMAGFVEGESGTDPQPSLDISGRRARARSLGRRNAPKARTGGDGQGHSTDPRDRRPPEAIPAIPTADIEPFLSKPLVIAHNQLGRRAADCPHAGKPRCGGRWRRCVRDRHHQGARSLLAGISGRVLR